MNVYAKFQGDLFLSEKVSDELKRQSAQQPVEDFYEAPMNQQVSSVPPPVPDSERPPVASANRHIDDLPCYDDPDSPQMSPPPITGLPPSLPRPTSNQGYHVLNPDNQQDSGGTFTTSTISSCTEDGELYEDVNDNGDFDDSFSDYDSDDQLEVLNPDTDSGVISPSSTKEKKKKKKDDWENFLSFLEADNNTCDHAGRLHFSDPKSTLKIIFKPKVYFCAATNERLLAYLPKKDYGKPQIDIHLHSGCEISSMGRDSNKEYGIQVQAKKGKTYNFSSNTQMDADKWIETLKKYTNQGLEYDVTHVTVEKTDSLDGNDLTSPPTGMEDPMIGKPMQQQNNFSNNMEIISDFIVVTLLNKLYKKNQKKKQPPQITEEDGVLQGYANVLRAPYSKQDWAKKWIMIKNHHFYCHKNKNDDCEFSVSLKDVELAAPEPKIVKKGHEGALKFHKEMETLFYVEALNPLDVGKIMKQALNAMMVSGTASKSSIVRRETTVDTITKFYEALETGVTEQPQLRCDAHQSMYINTTIGGLSSPESEPSTPDILGDQENRLYVNTQVGGARSFRKLSPSTVPQDTSEADIYEDTDNIQENMGPPALPDPRKPKSKTLPKLMPSETAQSVYENIKMKNPFSRKKKQASIETKEVEDEEVDETAKKEKKKKDKKKDKKKKKSKKDEIEHPDEPPPDPPQSYDTPQPTKPTLTRTLTVENKFKDSDKKHLLDADRLQGEKKEVEARKKGLSDIKKDIQNKRKCEEDPTEKANLDYQFKSVQTEWSQCSKRLAELEEEIEKATKATVPQLGMTSVSNETQLMKNSPVTLRRGGSDSRRSSVSSHGAEGGSGSMTSPERECATSDMSLQDKIRRFQQK